MTERIGAILRINSYIQSVHGKIYLNGKQVDCVALDQTCFFKDGSDIELDDEQITDLFDQTHGKKPATNAPVEPTRDTQFAHFAILLYQELCDRCLVQIDRPLVRDFMKKVIAQRAYDLVVHTLHITDYPDRFNLDNAMQEIPDMTAWPEASK